MILFSNDNDQTVFDKIDLLNTKKKFLIKDKITEEGLQFIRLFIQETLSKVDDTQILVRISFIY
jgi:hypothetical protein